MAELDEGPLFRLFREVMSDMRSSKGQTNWLGHDVDMRPDELRDDQNKVLPILERTSPVINRESLLKQIDELRLRSGVALPLMAALATRHPNTPDLLKTEREMLPLINDAILLEQSKFPSVTDWKHKSVVSPQEKRVKYLSFIKDALSNIGRTIGEQSPGRLK